MNKQEAINNLKGILAEGDTVYTVLRHCSSSGMTRYMDVFVMRDNEPRRLTWSVANALGWTYSDKHSAVKVGGCGMDMGFHLVYTLGRVLNLKGDSKDAGYSFHHQWL